MQAIKHTIPLIDGSYVYDVYLIEGDKTIIMHCKSEMHADDLISTLIEDTIDIEIQ